MYEAKWLKAVDVTEMLQYLERQRSDRKFRLFGCACCRRIWPRLGDALSQNAVEIAEQYVDGNVTLSVILAAYRDAGSIVGDAASAAQLTADCARTAVESAGQC